MQSKTMKKIAIVNPVMEGEIGNRDKATFY